MSIDIFESEISQFVDWYWFERMYDAPRGPTNCSTGSQAKSRQTQATVTIVLAPVLVPVCAPLGVHESRTARPVIDNKPEKGRPRLRTDHILAYLTPVTVSRPT